MHAGTASLLGTNAKTPSDRKGLLRVYSATPVSKLAGQGILTAPQSRSASEHEETAKDQKNQLPGSNSKTRQALGNTRPVWAYNKAHDMQGSNACDMRASCLMRSC